MEKGCVVRSVSGRDAQRFYVVLEIQGEYALIADGKVRRLEKPKRKNQKHLRKTNTVIPLEHLTTNHQLRVALRAFNAPQDSLNQGR